MADHGKIITADLLLGGRETPTRVAFVAPSLRTARRLIGTLRSMRDNPNDAVGELLGVVGPLVRGWNDATDVETGEPVPFDQNDLDRILTAADLPAIAGAILTGGKLTEAERKN